MTTQLTDAERAAIEQEIKAIYDQIYAAGERVDMDAIVPHMSDVYNLGFINIGHFFPSLDEFSAAFRERFSQLERQEMHEPTELRVSVLAPNVVVLTDLLKGTVYRKDGTAPTIPFAHTHVFAKVEGEWKWVHFHQSVPPQT